jgi:TolB-like protein
VLLIGLVFLLSLGAGAYYLIFIQGKSDRSLAVLVFDAPESDPELRALADRLTTEVTNQVTKVPGLKVALPTEVARIKPNVPPKVAGRELERRAVLTGILSRQRGTITLSVKLIDVEADSLLWSSDKFEVQAGREEVIVAQWANAIAGAVQQHLK